MEKSIVMMLAIVAVFALGIIADGTQSSGITGYATGMFITNSGKVADQSLVTTKAGRQPFILYNALNYTVKEGPAIHGELRKPKPAPLRNDTCELQTLEERVGCRLELNISLLSYRPEICRSKPSRFQTACLETFAHTHRCLTLTDAARRSVCMQKMAKLQSVKAEQISCDNEKGNQSRCQQVLNARFDQFITQSIYMLELRAIEFHQKKGVPESIVIPFVKNIEEQTLKFNALKTKPEKTKVLLDTEALWDAFSKEAQANAKKKIGIYDINSNIEPRLTDLKLLKEI